MISWFPWMAFSGWWGGKEGSVLHSCSETQAVRVLPSVAVPPDTAGPWQPQVDGFWRRVHGFSLNQTAHDKHHLWSRFNGQNQPQGPTQLQRSCKCRLPCANKGRTHCWHRFQLCLMPRLWLRASYSRGALLGSEDVAVNRRARWWARQAHCVGLFFMFFAII